MPKPTSWNPSSQEQRIKQVLEDRRQQLEAQLGREVVIQPETLDRAAQEYVQNIERFRAKLRKAGAK